MKLSEEYRNLFNINILSSIQQELGLVKPDKKGKSKNRKENHKNGYFSDLRPYFLRKIVS